MPTKSTGKTPEQLVAENAELRARLDEAEDTLRAIRSGEVDALVVAGADGDQVFTLMGVDRTYRALIEQMNEGALILTADGLILYANRCLGELLKAPLEQVVGSAIDAWLAPDSRRLLRDLLHTGAAGKHYDELALTARDGTRVPIDLSANPLVMAELPDAFCLVVTDITARKQAEEALRENEQRLVSIYNTVGDVVFHLAVESEGQYRFVSLNPAFQKVTGLSPEMVVGKMVNEIIPEPSLTMVLGKYRQAIEEKTTVHWEEISDYPTGRLTGEVGIAPVFDHQGTCTHLVGSVHDITARKQAEEMIGRLNAELEQRVQARTAQLEASNRELEAFSYSAAHDLRAPLRGIDGWSMALLEDYGPQLDAQAHDYLNRVRSEAQHMAQLIDALQQLARITRTELRLRTVDLSALARISAARLQAAQPERQFDFGIQAGLLARGDADLLEIALTNLLANAAKFTGPRAVARIEFGLTQVNDRPVYFVRDNGVGFDVTHAQNLFGAFQRLHRATEFPGTGVGLATVRRILIRHGGQIWAEAAVEQGATFYFTLPSPDL